MDGPRAGKSGQIQNSKYLQIFYFKLIGIIDDVLKSVTIKENDSIFEFGCGTGAVLKRILETHSGTNIVIGGSDISINAIKKAQSQTLLAKNGQFYVISMTTKNELIADNTQDLVISFGAFAMYLFKEEMIVALKEALRFQTK